ncbi:MAG: YegP family protein [Eubacteriaceae bacterium]|nr:YegP family protein [Eubacteriaceae bacterium]
MGKFEVKEAKNGGYVFNLKAANGEVIAVSEVYKTEDNCLSGIVGVKKAVEKADIEDQTVENYAVAAHPKFEVYKDKAGEFRFRLKAVNGEIIATGESYKTKDGCLNGIESIKKNAPDAPVEK